MPLINAMFSIMTFSAQVCGFAPTAPCRWFDTYVLFLFVCVSVAVAVAVAVSVSVSVAVAVSVAVSVSVPSQLTQGLSPHQSELMQIPHFTEHEVRHAKRGKKKAESLRSYINSQTDPDNMKGTRDMSADQKQEVLDFFKVVPRLEVSVDLSVEGEEGLCEEDIMTATITVTHANVEEVCRRGHRHHIFVCRPLTCFAVCCCVRAKTCPRCTPRSSRS